MSASPKSTTEDPEKAAAAASTHGEDAAAPIVSNEEYSPLYGLQFAGAMFFILFGLVLSVIETSITATALVTIGDYFDDHVKATWVVLAYLLSYMGFSVIFARLSDGIGKLEATIVAWVFFGAFSLGAGLARSLNELIGFRVLQGIGGSGLYSMTFILGIPVIPLKYFGIFSGIIGMTFATGSILGPLLGGVITQSSSWRWIYLFNAPCTVVGIAGLLLVFPRRKSEKLRQSVSLRKLKGVDILGALLLLAASTLLVFAMEQAGSAAYRWNSPIIISTLTIAGLCWVGFFAWIGWLTYGKNIQLKPILPLTLCSTRPIGPAILVVLLTGFPYFIAIIHLPYRFQLVNGDSPIGAGVKLLPMLCSTAFASAIGGVMSSKKDHTSETVIVASWLITLACGLFSTISGGHSIDKAVYGYEVLLGLGVGLTFSATTVMANTVRREDSAAAQGAVSQVRIIGGSLGLGVATIVFNSELVKQLSGVLSPEQLYNVQRSLTTMKNLSTEDQAAVIHVLDTSFNKQMRICLYVTAVNVLVALATYTRNRSFPTPPGVNEETRNSSGNEENRQ